jgi:REP element-mobilizing transposase RayT
MTKPHKEWYSRGYLPHFDHAGLVQTITFRLADSLPAHLIDLLRKEIPEDDEITRSKRIESYLDAGFGSFSLADPRVGELMENAFLFFDGQRYRLVAWVVMPNHVHVLVEIFPDCCLPDISHSWKSYTANEANRLLCKSGRFWEAEYFDRYIRDVQHYESAVRYIHENPVKARLAKSAGAYRSSSAWRILGLDAPVCP